MISTVKIRQMVEGDHKSIAALTNQLGANISSQMVYNQMGEILRNPDHFAFVAMRNHHIVGYIHCFTAIRLTSQPFTEICGLIVDVNERGNGIGKLLVQRVEGLFDGNRKIRVRCNAKRESAHQFYYHLKYSLSKHQNIFEKEMAQHSGQE